MLDTHGVDQDGQGGRGLGRTTPMGTSFGRHPSVRADIRGRKIIMESHPQNEDPTHLEAASNPPLDPLLRPLCEGELPLSEGELHYS